MHEPEPTFALLVVDDDEVVRALIRETFDRDGRFRVVAEAVDGRDAVPVLDYLRVDAVILDLAMPDVSGMEILPMLREAAPEAAIVVYSALAPDRLVQIADTGQVDAVVSKTAPPSTLVDHVIHAIERRAVESAAAA
jgi:DNA-binding NarL/FixJ family response regulator